MVLLSKISKFTGARHPWHPFYLGPCDVAAKLHYFQLFIIDVNGFRLGPEYPFRTAYENLVLLNKELELYNPDLLKKPCVLAVNKMDTENSKEKLTEFETCLQSNMEKGIGKVII